MSLSSLPVRLGADGGVLPPPSSRFKSPEADWQVFFRKKGLNILLKIFLIILNLSPTACASSSSSLSSSPLKF